MIPSNTVHNGDTASDAANAAPHGAPAISGVDGASTADVEPAPRHDGAPGCRGARRRRRVVALSPRDQERVSRGENPEDLARADYEHNALSGVGGGLDAPETGGAGSNDARLKRDVPPHWG